MYPVARNEFTKRPLPKRSAAKGAEHRERSATCADLTPSLCRWLLGRKEGAQALAGGARLTEGALSKGYFVPPTVFANVQDDMRIAQEEIFGPVISAISFKDSDELIQRANATTFGLGSGVWTKDVSKAHRVAKALRAGSV
jgi:acyl-CoA reductase-like NAD-dependent aldehyde dehydrogenase